MVWREQENAIYNINRFVLQGSGKIVEGCLTREELVGGGAIFTSLFSSYEPDDAEFL